MEESRHRHQDDTTKEVVLALDVGSSSVRCSAYKLSNDAKIEKIQSASKTVSCVKPNSGKILWYHGNDTLLDIIDQCVDETLQKLRSDKVKFKVSAVGFSSFVMNLVGIDENGNFVDEEATMSYACNTIDVAKECKAMRDELGDEGSSRLYQETGAPIHSSYAIAQLRVIYKSAKKEYVNRIHGWQTIASLCLGRWTNKEYLQISFSEASWTGLLNFKTCRYSEIALSLLPERCRKALPDLEDVSSPHTIGIPEYLDTNVKRKKNGFFEKWSELHHAAFFLGIGDGACANVGSKAVSESRIAVTIGTSAAARICLPLRVSSESNFEVPKGLFCYRVNRDHVLVGGALTDGGSVVEWAEQLLNLSDKESFLACMKEVEKLSEEDYKDSSPSSSSQLCMIPFLSGERATGFRGGATGSMIGLTRETTPAHFFKACLEGVTLRLRAVLKLLVDARMEQSQGLPTVVVSGKALEVNQVWRQMISDSSGLELVLDSETFEGTSRGVARILSLGMKATKEKVGSQPFVEEPLHPKTVIQPRAFASQYFNQSAVQHDEFLSAVSPIYTRNDTTS